MKKYERLLQVVRECDYRVLEAPGCGCQAAQARCLMGRGGWARDRHEVYPNDCLQCTKKGKEDGRVVVADTQASAGDDGVKDSGDEPPITDRGYGAERIGSVVLESGIEREILHLERELFLLQDEVRRLSELRFPATEQQLAALWYNPNPCTTPSFILSPSLPSPQNSGTNITFTMTDSDSPLATGTVQFLDGSTNIGTLQTLSGGVASVSTSSLSVASHTINANYSGDGTYCSGTQSIPYTIQASSYDPCVSGVVAGSYHLHDPFLGTTAFNFTTGSFTSGFQCFNANTPAYGSCGATLFAAFSFLTQCPAKLRVAWCQVTATGCVSDGEPGCSGTLPNCAAAGSSLVVSTWLLTSATQTPLSLTFTAQGPIQLPYTVGQTITIDTIP